MKRSIALHFPALLILSLFIAGCTTSGGSLFKEMTSHEEQPEAEVSDDDTQEEPTNEETAGVTIDTLPADADVYINGFYRGETPLHLDSIKAGEYSIELQKEGYKTVSRWITFDGESHLELVYQLEQMTGFLKLVVSPEEASVYLDGSIIDDTESSGSGPERAFLELQVGEYRVKVERFGYRPYQNEVTITEGDLTELSVELQSAPFEIDDPEVTPSRFSPENPGNLGTTKLSFSVTDYGEGSLHIYNLNGEEVTSVTFPSFTTWEQSFRWDGTDHRGEPVPDGEYTAVLTAKSADSKKEITEELTITVDRSTIITFRSLWNGNSGLLFAPTAEILPQGTFQLSGLFLGHLEKIDEAITAWFPTQIGFRYGLIKNLELTAQASAIFSTQTTVPYMVGVSGKYRFLSTVGKNRIGLAVTAKGTYASGLTVDTLTNTSGFGVGLPFQAVFGPFHVVAVPEIVLSPIEISYNVPSEETFAVWSYGRVGFLFDFRLLTTGISGAIRTKSFTRGFSIQYPFSVGWELHWIIPHTQMGLTVGIAGEFAPIEAADPLDPHQGYYIMAGVGIEFIN